MTFLLTLLIIIVVLYYLPRIVLWLLAHFVRWKTKRAFNNFFDSAQQFRGQSDGNRRNQPQSEPSPRRRKKIDSDIGEYVHFEEVKTVFNAREVETPDGNTATRVTVEEQIVDVEWEDLPPEDKTPGGAKGRP